MRLDCCLELGVGPGRSGDDDFEEPSLLRRWLARVWGRTKTGSWRRPQFTCYVSSAIRTACAPDPHYGLRPTYLDRTAVGLFAPQLLGAYYRLRYRHESAEMDHGEAVDVTIEVARLIQCAVIARRAGMPVHREDPPEPRSPSSTQILSHASVGVKRQVRAVFLQNAARQDDRRSLPVQRTNLVNVQVTDVENLADRGRPECGQRIDSETNPGLRQDCVGPSVLANHDPDVLYLA